MIGRQPFPVLLIHGIDDRGIRFKRMQAAFEQNGIAPVVAMDIQPNDASIPLEAMALQVQAVVESLLQSSRAAQVDIVAYSMGSLAGRYFLQRLGGQRQVRRFIAIAGPQQGTYMAYMRQNVGCRQMRPGSAFLQDLNGDQDPWGAVQVVCFWTPFDLMMLPCTTSRLPGVYNRAFFVPIHPLMLSSPAVIRAVIQTLAAP